MQLCSVYNKTHPCQSVNRKLDHSALMADTKGPGRRPHAGSTSLDWLSYLEVQRILVWCAGVHELVVLLAPAQPAPARPLPMMMHAHSVIRESLDKTAEAKTRLHM